MKSFCGGDRGDGFLEKSPPCLPEAKVRKQDSGQIGGESPVWKRGTGHFPVKKILL
jgi:hypothetical protein